MGCNVHLHIEVKIEDEWHHLNHLTPKRNYAMFARMAGVRNEDGDYDPIALPRGLPDDATALTRIDSAAWEGDGHSHSWLSWSEVEGLVLFAENFCPMGLHVVCQFEEWLGNGGNGIYLFGDGWDRIEEGEDASYIARGVTDLRFVFWFDN